MKQKLKLLTQPFEQIKDILEDSIENKDSTDGIIDRN